MELKRWQRAAILVALSIFSSVMAYLAIDEPWFHHHSVYATESETIADSEYRFFLDEWTTPSDHTLTYNQGSNFWVPVEPIHSFMAVVETLVQLCILLPLVVAALALPRYRVPHLVASSASLALFAGVVIAFFLGFVDACNDSDLPGVPEIPSFMGSETEVWLSLTDTDVWGPLSAWWLLLVASVVQGAGLALALKFWKNEAV